MTRQDWGFSTHSLRKLLHKFKEEDGFLDGMNVATEYRFSVKYNPMFGFFHIWDGMHSPLHSTIATIKVSDKEFCMRYLPSTMFKEELLKFRLTPKRSIFLPSLNVTRHDDWVRGNTDNRTQRAIRERVSFLALQSQVQEASGSNTYHLRVSVPLPVTLSYQEYGPTTSIEPSTTEVLVEFGQPPTTMEQQRAISIVRELVHRNVRINMDGPVRFRDLISVWDITLQSEAERERRNRLQDSMTMRPAGIMDTVQHTYMGRPIEQLQEYVRATSPPDLALTEETFMRAVRALDEANEPREWVERPQDWSRTRTAYDERITGGIYVSEN